MLNQPSTTGNLILGNRIGTDLTGARALPNGEQGVLIYEGASDNTIGAANLDGSSANIISGNTQAGIQIQDTSTGNVVLGNRVGLTAQGTASLPNLGDGILVNAAGNIIGGTAQGAGNVISGNLGFGVHITDSLPGFATTSADDNQILGNLIGVNPSGISSGIGNVESGVEIDSASGTTVGGVTAVAGAGAGNVISGNRQAGIELTGSSTATLIQGNLVGLNADGTAGQGNLLSGMILDAVSGNTIGGSQTGAGNVLSNNGVSGLEIDQGSAATVEGNLIGTDPSGTTSRGNLQNGLIVTGSTNNTIAGNVLSGNNLSGLSDHRRSRVGQSCRWQPDRHRSVGARLPWATARTEFSSVRPLPTRSAERQRDRERDRGQSRPGNRDQRNRRRPGRNNVVTGNLIGTTAPGPLRWAMLRTVSSSRPVPSRNTIGGTTAGSGNVISANQANGVELVSGATGNEVAGNLIGTDGSGELALGNNNVGVAINSAWREYHRRRDGGHRPGGRERHLRQSLQRRAHLGAGLRQQPGRRELDRHRRVRQQPLAQFLLRHLDRQCPGQSHRRRRQSAQGT